MKRLEQNERKLQPNLVESQEIADLACDDQNQLIPASKRSSGSTEINNKLSGSAMPSHIRVLVHDGEDRREVWRRLADLLEEVANEEG